jgi:hypothetical protein
MAGDRPQGRASTPLPVEGGEPWLERMLIGA